MEIRVVRLFQTKTETICAIYLDGEFFCFGLEDIYRDFKVYGETRTPAGRYKIRVRNFGGFHERYLKKYDFHKGMLQVMGVPGFTDILIHIGNYAANTNGCLLVGTSAVADFEGSCMVGSSTDAYEKLYKKVIDKALVGAVEIVYIDQDVF